MAALAAQMARAGAIRLQAGLMAALAAKQAVAMEAIRRQQPLHRGKQPLFTEALAEEEQLGQVDLGWLRAAARDIRAWYTYCKRQHKEE